jgi:hypothetical protein
MDAHRTSLVTAAWIYAAQHQDSHALDLLEQAATWRDRRMLYIEVNPFLESLYRNPRFRRLIQEMRL